MAITLNLKRVLVFLISLICFAEYHYVRSEEFKRCQNQGKKTNFNK